MPKLKTSGNGGRRLRHATAEEMQTARAEEKGARFEWHYGRVTRLGNFELPGSREVTVVLGGGGHQLPTRRYQR